MSEEEYNNRIGKINAEISTDRVDADREHYLLLQKLYLKDRYIKGLQQKVEQLEKENETLNSVLETLKETNSLLINQKYKLEYELDTLDNKYEQLENIRKKAIKATKDVKQFVYDELVDRNVSGATETHCKIMDLLNILNKGSDKQ